MYIIINTKTNKYLAKTTNTTLNSYRSTSRLERAKLFVTQIGANKYLKNSALNPDTHKVSRITTI